MGITEKQLSRRVGNIGASQVAAILGLSPWANATDVWYEVTGRTEPLPGSQAMDLGNRLEPVCIQYYKDLNPERRVISGGEYRLEGTPLLVHPDARAYDADQRELVEIVEAKQAGATNMFADLSQWGEEFTDQVPLHYLVQCMAQLAACSAASCAMIAFLSGRGLVEYRIPRDHELIEKIVGEVCDWYERFVKPDIKPDAPPPNMETIRRVRRSLGIGAEVDPGVVRRWYEAKARAKAAEAEADEAQAAMLHALPDEADYGMVQGLKVFGYGLVKGRVTLDSKRLEAEQPEIYQQYSKVGADYRRLSPSPKALASIFGEGEQQS